jgi:VIT1/CCC1 family predicted Fe2+/Mn2+ transporter
MKDALAAAKDLNQDDPFLITTRTSLGRRLIIDEMRVSASFPRMAKDYERPMLPGRLRNRDIANQKRHALILRFGSASIGGIALIGPMLLMLLHKSLATSLITVSVFVFIFGFGLAAFSLDSMPRDIMVAVAAYAAVLVVFVGSSS